MIETAPEIQAPTETVTPIKPSEAIRLGRLRWPNKINRTFYNVPSKAACIMGAMIAGYGQDEHSALPGIRGNITDMTGLPFGVISMLIGMFDTSADLDKAEEACIKYLEDRGL